MKIINKMKKRVDKVCIMNSLNMILQKIKDRNAKLFHNSIRGKS